MTVTFSPKNGRDTVGCMVSVFALVASTIAIGGGTIAYRIVTAERDNQDIPARVSDMDHMAHYTP